jgi:hypothetical protein
MQLLPDALTVQHSPQVTARQDLAVGFTNLYLYRRTLKFTADSVPAERDGASRRPRSPAHAEESAQYRQGRPADSGE